MYQGKMDSRVTPSLDEPECLGHYGVWWMLENEERGAKRKWLGTQREKRREMVDEISLSFCWLAERTELMRCDWE